MLLDRSGGNPFFLEELLALIGDSDLAGQALAGGSGALVELPDTLRGLVSARIDGLTDDERSTLEDAAVWGRSGPVLALEKMAKALRDRERLDVVLAGLADKEVLQVEAGHWSFRSDLIREVAYGTLTKADRARRHHGIASYLSHQVGDRAQVDERVVDVVAFHYGAAAELTADLGVVDGVPSSVTAVALEWIEEAARRAEVAQALPVASRLYTQALLLLGHEPSVRRVQLLLGRAGVEADRRSTETARSDVEVAHRLAVELGDETGLAQSLLVRGEIERGGGDLLTAVATLADAAERFRALDDVRGAADAIREIGMAQIFLGEHAEAERSIRSALEASRQIGDRRGEGWALQHLAWISFIEGRSVEAESRLHRSAQAFAELGDVGGLGWATGLLAFVRFNQGKLDEARSLGEQVLVEARERGDRWGEGMMLLLGAGVALWSGHAVEATERSREAHTLFRAIGDPFGATQSLAALGRCLVATGRVQEGLELLRTAEADATGQDRNVADRVTLAAALAGAAVAAGDPEAALAAVDGVRADLTDRSRVGVAEHLIARGMALVQAGRASEAVDLLRDQAEGDAETAPSAYAQSALALALAGLGAGDEVATLATLVAENERATYLDRVSAGIAAGLVRARGGDERALGELAELVAEVDATDDVVAQVVTRLAEAEALAHLGGARPTRPRWPSRPGSPSSACRPTGGGWRSGWPWRPRPPRCPDAPRATPWGRPRSHRPGSSVGVVGSAAGLGHGAQVGLDGGELAEALLGLVVGHRGADDDVVAVLPVGRGRHLVLRGELQRVDHPQELVEVAPRARRVGEGELDLVVGPDHEDRAHGHGVAGVRVDEVVEVAHLAVGVGDDREVDRLALRLLDVLGPLAVRVDGVDAQADHLDVALVELGLELGHRAQLGGADRGEVLRVREEHRPAVALPVVEVDGAFGGVGGEVRGVVAQQYGHGALLEVRCCRRHSRAAGGKPDKKSRVSGITCRTRRGRCHACKCKQSVDVSCIAWQSMQ